MTRLRQPPPAPGKDTDTVPAWLSPGEYVLKRDAVKRIGVDKLNRLNNGYQDGGVVDPPAPRAQWVGGAAPRAQLVNPPAVTTGPATLPITEGLITNFASPKDLANFARTGSLETGDNGVGAPNLGGVNTANSYGLAFPEEYLTKNLGSDPAAWRSARAQLTVNNQTVNVPIVDIGPGKKEQKNGVVTDATYPLSQAFGGFDMAHARVQLVPNAGPDYTTDQDGWNREQSDIAAQFGHSPAMASRQPASFQQGGVVKPDEAAALQTAGQYAGTPQVLTPENAQAYGLDPSRGFIATPMAPQPVVPATPPTPRPPSMAPGLGTVAGAPEPTRAEPSNYPVVQVEGEKAVKPSNYPVVQVEGESKGGAPAVKPSNYPVVQVEGETPQASQQTATQADTPNMPPPQAAGGVPAAGQLQDMPQGATPAGPQTQEQAQQALVAAGHSPGAAQAIVNGQQPATISGNAPAPQQAPQQQAKPGDADAYALSQLSPQEQQLYQQSQTVDPSKITPAMIAANDKYSAALRTFWNQQGTSTTQQPAQQPSQPGAQQQPAQKQPTQQAPAAPTTGQAATPQQKRGAVGPGAAFAVAPDKPGNIGVYGYVGDTTPDKNSLWGIGAFAHSKQAHSLIDGYSAALTKEGAAMRGVKPGQEFLANGKVYRYDDVTPSDFILNGVHHHVSANYVDVYTPNHAPDKGVSAGEIARQAKIAGHGPGAEAGDGGGGGGGTAGKGPAVPTDPTNPFQGQPLASIPISGDAGSNVSEPGRGGGGGGGGGVPSPQGSPGDMGWALSSFGGQGGASYFQAPPAQPARAQPSAAEEEEQPMVAALMQRGFSRQEALDFAQSSQAVSPGKGIGPLQQKEPPPAPTSAAQLPAPSGATIKLVPAKQLMPGKVPPIVPQKKAAALPAPPAAPGAPTPAPAQAKAPTAAPPAPSKAPEKPWQMASTETVKPLGLRAAVRTSDGDVVTGHDHDDAYSRAENPRNGEFGFADKDGKFVSFNDAEQRLNPGRKPPPEYSTLETKFSEDPGWASQPEVQKGVLPEQVGPTDWELAHPKGPPRRSWQTEAEAEATPYTGAPAGSTHGIASPEGFDALKGLKLLEAIKAHADLVSPDDPRVRKQADGKVKGEHFVEGDPVHDRILEGLPGGNGGRDRGILARAEEAIRERRPMHISYISAPKEAALYPTRESRLIQYDNHSPEARLMGETTGQLVGHSFIPVAVGINAPRTAKPNEPVIPGTNTALHEGVIHGISTNVMANNFEHINQKLAEMGRESPYKTFGTKFANDLEGYLSNLNAGHTGTGRGYATGTADLPSDADTSHVPYKLTRGEADFINLVLNNTQAFSKNEGGVMARELAHANGTLINENGETNRLRFDIERHSPGWAIRQKGGRPVLEPTIRTFSTGLVHEIHPNEERMPATIRPGKAYQDLTKAMARTSERGRPDMAVAASLHHTYTDNKAINNIERAFSEHKIDEAEARSRLKSMGEDPGEYRFIGGSGGLITPYEDDPESITPEEHGQMKQNLRNQWVNGKMGVDDYRKKVAEVPLPQKPSQPTPAAPTPKAVPSSQVGTGGMQWKGDAGDVVPGKTSKLGDVIEHPELFKAHPWLKKVNVRHESGMEEHGGFDEQDPADKSAPGLIRLRYGGYEQDPEEKGSDWRRKDILAHEIQHAIQAKKGGSPKPEIDEGAIRAQATKDYNATYGTGVVHEYSRNRYANQLVGQARAKAYQDDPAEIEAREAQQAHAAPGEKPGRQTVDPDRVVKKRKSDQLHWVPSQELDKRWNTPENKQVYLGPGGGKNQIEDRYPQAMEHLATDKPVNAPEVTVKDDGSADFIDGRHTFAAMRDSGHTHVPVALDQESTKNAKQTGLVAGAAAEAPPEGAPPAPTGPKFKAPKKAPAPKEKLTKPTNWKDEADEATRQAYLEQRVANTIAGQQKHKSAIPLRVKRKEDGSIQYDQNLNPVWHKTDYNLADMPFLKKKGKGVSNLEEGDKHEDTLDKNEHKHLNQTERRRLSALRAQNAVKTLGDRIFKSYQAIKDIPEIAAGKGWYSSMRDKMEKAFGKGEGGKASDDHELFAQLLGATSAKTPVRDNFIQALDAFEQKKSGAFDRHIKLYCEAYNKMKEGNGALSEYMKSKGIKPLDEDGNEIETHKSDADAMAHWIDHHKIRPLQKNGSKYNANSDQVLKVLAGTWLDEVGAPKTPNFAGNLTGRTLAATIDVWAARHLHRLGHEGEQGQWRPQSLAEPGVNSLDFAYAQDAMKHAADKIGINPDDLQAILWYAEKHHYEQQGWTGAQGANKGSFDETWDKAFPKEGEHMTAAGLREHYQTETAKGKRLGAIQKTLAGKRERGEKEKTIESYLKQHADPFLEKHGMTREHLEGPPAAPGVEEDEEAA